MPDISDTIRYRLRTHRQHLGIDQIDLAEAIGKSRPLIVAMERGESAITVEQIEAFAKVLRVPVGYFFGEFDGISEDEAEIRNAYASLSDHGKKLALAAIAGMARAEARMR